MDSTIPQLGYIHFTVTPQPHTDFHSRKAGCDDHTYHTNTAINCVSIFPVTRNMLLAINLLSGNLFRPRMWVIIGPIIQQEQEHIQKLSIVRQKIFT